MQFIQLPLDDMSSTIQVIQIIQIRSLPDLKYLDHELGIDGKSKVWEFYNVR